jgi:hypothetical protein
MGGLQPHPAAVLLLLLLPPALLLLPALTCAEDDHVSILQVAYGPAPYVGLSHLAHLNGGLHPASDAQVLQRSLAAAAAAA